MHIDGADMPLYKWLAQQLAVRNNIAPTDLPPDFCLNDVVAHHVKKGGERNALYSQINHCLADARLSPDVPALHGLATILPLNLFVTLSFDSLLAQAITKVRTTAPQQCAYAPNDIGDLPAGRQALKQPEGAATVFHLFGIASSPPDFVICDDDKLETLAGHKDSVRSVAFSSDGKQLASGSRDGIVILWDIATPIPANLATLAARAGKIVRVNFSPDGKQLAFGSQDGTMGIWNLDPAFLQPKPAAPLTATSPAPNGSNTSAPTSPTAKPAKPYPRQTLANSPATDCVSQI